MSMCIIGSVHYPSLLKIAKKIVNISRFNILKSFSSNSSAAVKLTSLLCKQTNVWLDMKPHTLTCCLGLIISS
jgi:hypothetical protein